MPGITAYAVLVGRVGYGVSGTFVDIKSIMDSSTATFRQPHLLLIDFWICFVALDRFLDMIVERITQYNSRWTTLTALTVGVSGGGETVFAKDAMVVYLLNIGRITCVHSSGFAETLLER